MSVDAISPSDVSVYKSILFPDVIIESVNELIIENASIVDGKFVNVKILQDEILTRIRIKDSTMSRDEIFKKGWLDIEPIYRDKGWIVTYHKPHFDDTFSPFFDFKSIIGKNSSE